MLSAPAAMFMKTTKAAVVPAKKTIATAKDLKWLTATTTTNILSSGLTL